MIIKEEFQNQDLLTLIQELFKEYYFEYKL